MPPKKAKKGKKGGKKKKKEEVDPNLLTEVDRTFYELQITDLNRKLARLRSETEQLEVKNEELTNELAKVDEDRSDIIIYLKRMLQEKSDEIHEIQERLTALEETRQNETEEYENKMKELEDEYKLLHEQLTSEIKLLEGKLNALEEFRIQRDELMRKYEAQEVQMDEQEKRHKRELYETEKKFIIGKDKLKKEMEARLLQLSTEFHDATELRIASTTHRVIRENIAINNELEIMLGTHKRLHSENMKMKERDRALRQKAELYESEVKQALRKSKVQTNVIERLTVKNRSLDIEVINYQNLKRQFTTLMQSNEKMTLEVAGYLRKMKLLEQNLHQSRTDRARLETKMYVVQDENDIYVDVLHEAVNAIRKSLSIGSSESDESLKVSGRESLLNNLLNLMTTVDERKAKKRDSVDTVKSVTSIYATGDLGFVPKPVMVRSKIPTRRNIETQVGSSIDLISTDRTESGSAGYDAQFDVQQEPKTEEIEEESIVFEEEKMSRVFFGDDDSCEEESTVSYGSDDLKMYMAARQGLTKYSTSEMEDGTTQDTQRSTKESVVAGPSRSRSAYESDFELRAKQSQHVYQKLDKKGKEEAEGEESELREPEDGEKEIPQDKEAEIAPEEEVENTDLVQEHQDNEGGIEGVEDKGNIDEVANEDDVVE